MSFMPMDKQKRPNSPAIPEIVKAYQNDPRTQLAMQALGAGTTTSPVATGKYAYADGIARALQSIAGGYMARKQMQQYGSDEEKLLALRAQRGVDGLNGTTPVGLPSQPIAPPMQQAATPPPQPPQPAAQAAPQIAAALGAPPPEPPPQPNLIGPVASLGPMQGGLPGRQRPFASTPVTTRKAEPGQPSQAMAFVDPLAGLGRPTSGYGPRRAPVRGASTYHNGQDFAAPQGTPVLAASGGTVLRAWNDTKFGGGLSVLVRHPDGSTTGYAHLNDIKVERGAQVEPGQPIGSVGRTGRATGPHLHFTYRDPNGKRLNPMEAIKFTPLDQLGVEQVEPPQEQPNTQTASQLEMPPEMEMLARPNRPESKPAAKSRTLDAAYRIMADANRYESASGQDMYERGLAEQTRLDEAAIDREQQILNAVYSNDFNAYLSDRNNRVQDNLNTRRDIRTRGWQVEDREDNQQYNTSERIAGQKFQGAEADKNRKFQADQTSRQFQHDQTMARFSRDTQMALQSSAQAAARELQREQLIAQGTLKDQEAKNRRSNFFMTSAGAKLYNETANSIYANDVTVEKLRAFEETLQRTKTGGFVLGNMPGLTSWSSTDLQVLDKLTKDLAKSASQDMKGALSDRDVQFLQDIMPNIRSTNRANRETITRIRLLAERANDFQRSKLRAMSDGEGTEFLYQWSAYIRAVPPTPNAPSFDDWRTSIPTFDTSGQRVK